MDRALPKRLTSYIHDMGVRALDHLAEASRAPEEQASADALRTLVEHWRSMNTLEREAFVNQIGASVAEVIMASALLPAGIKVGGKVVKSARKALERSGEVTKKGRKADDSARKKRRKKQEAGRTKQSGKRKAEKKESGKPKNSGKTKRRARSDPAGKKEREKKKKA